ncbi:hypothetical protein BZA77DRAFT_353128 [Pyronema omphalodes]|nr:hypothetical protein BZA77DRAFT_353128 [Pyronema omphalodes]
MKFSSAAVLFLTAITATVRASPSTAHHDLLKIIAEAPTTPTGEDGLQRQKATLIKRRYGCDNGYEQCPGVSYCCQAGLTCFSDGTCGTLNQLTCQEGETPCGQGTRAGCCPYKSSCVGDGVCAKNSGDVTRVVNELGLGGLGGALMAVGVGVVVAL